jgi:serine/threonine protein kinase
VRPGILEIKGAYPTSSLMYIRAESIQGLIVNSRASTIELLLVSGFPSKILDFTSGQLSPSVEILCDFIGQKNKPSDVVVSDRAETHIKECRRIVDTMTIKDYGERISSMEVLMVNIIANNSALNSSIDTVHTDIDKLREDVGTLKGVDDDTDDTSQVSQISEISQASHKSQTCEQGDVSNIDVIFAMCIVLFILTSVVIMSIPSIQL